MGGGDVPRGWGIGVPVQKVDVCWVPISVCMEGLLASHPEICNLDRPPTIQERSCTSTISSPLPLPKQPPTVPQPCDASTN